MPKGFKAVLKISMSYLNTIEEVDIVIEQLKRIVGEFT